LATTNEKNEDDLDSLNSRSNI